MRIILSTWYVSVRPLVNRVIFISTIYRRMWPNGTEGSSVDAAASVTSIYVCFNVRCVDGIASDKVVAIESYFVSYP